MEGPCDPKAEFIGNLTGRDGLERKLGFIKTGYLNWDISIESIIGYTTMQIKSILLGYIIIYNWDVQQCNISIILGYIYIWDL